MVTLTPDLKRFVKVAIIAVVVNFFLFLTAVIVGAIVSLGSPWWFELWGAVSLLSAFLLVIVSLTALIVVMVAEW